MRAALTLLFTLFSSSALAQGFDIATQDVRVDLTGAEIEIELEVTLEAMQDVRMIDLFTPALPIASLTVDGATLTATPHPQERNLARRVTLPQAAASGSLIRLHMVQRGTLNCRSIFTPGAIACVHNTNRTVLIPSQPGHAWHLVNLYASDPYTGTIEVRAPAEHQVVAGQGDPIETIDLGDGTAIRRFRVDVPAERLSINSGNLARIDSSAGFPTSGWFEDVATQREHMQRAVDLVSSLIPIYSEIYGETGLDRAHLVSVPTGFDFGAIGLLGTVLAGEYVFGELDYLLVQGMAHEFAHTWWGNIASAEDELESPFFGESMAEYSAWLALGRLQGDKVRTSGVRMNAVWYMYRRPQNQDVAILDPAAREHPAFIFALYHKGSVALRTWATMAGEDIFLRALRRLVTGTVSIPELARAIVEEGGPNIRSDMDSWLRGTGFPHLAVQTISEGENLRLIVDQVEELNWKLPIAARKADGSAATVLLDVGSGRFEHVLPAKDVVAVELDPLWTASREIIPAIRADVTFDGKIDAYDLIEVGLRQGTELPNTRRVDGGYDPLYDVNADRRVDQQDLDAVMAPE